MMTEALSKSLILTIAGESSADPRTVRKVLRGERVRELARDRIVRALSARGIEPLALSHRSTPIAATGAR